MVEGGKRLQATVVLSRKGIQHLEMIFAPRLCGFYLYFAFSYYAYAACPCICLAFSLHQYFSPPRNSGRGSVLDVDGELGSGLGLGLGLGCPVLDV